MNPLDYLNKITDPRKDTATKIYSAELILFLTLSAVLSGADGWTEVEEFGEEKKDWLKKYVEVPGDSIPSHDTIGDFFKRVKASEFRDCFISWVSSLTGILSESIVAIDGKTLRSSYDTGIGKKAIHMMSAWASDTRLILGQTKVDDKSNEITAIPDLLSLLELQGALVTIDAIGCQKNIANQIIEQQADYLLAVKANQPELLDDIDDTFKYTKADSVAITEEKSHGRIEVRKCSVIYDLTGIASNEHWRELKSIIKIEREREEISNNKKTNETMYYICSKLLHASTALESVRKHWGIENQVHYVLDVEFKEDLSRVRTGDADQNLSIIRRIALNLLKLDRSRGSINIKRHKAAWNDTFRQQILKV